MPEVHRNSSTKVPEFIREPLEAAQARIEAFEVEAQKVLRDLMKRRKDLADLVQKLSKQDWNTELRGRFGKLRDQGRERADELRGRAETFRADAVDRLENLQTKAIAFLGVASREEVLELSRELDKLVRRLEKSGKAAAKASARVKKLRKKAEA
jgi:hypothetical protein